MCYQTRILPIAVHSLGTVNVRADRLSKWRHDHTNIRLKPKVFKTINRRYGLHSADHFATRDNWLLNRYVSWRPNLSAVAVNALVTIALVASNWQAA